MRAYFNDKQFGDLFSPSSQAEVSISGTITLNEQGLSVPVTGQIDRIAILDHRILVCDYKTSLIPPVSLETIKPEHLTQVALYKTLLADLYPQHRITAYLLYTATGLMIEVPDILMKASLDQLARRETQRAQA